MPDKPKLSKKFRRYLSTSEMDMMLAYSLSASSAIAGRCLEASSLKKVNGLSRLPSSCEVQETFDTADMARRYRAAPLPAVPDLLQPPRVQSVLLVQPPPCGRCSYRRLLLRPSCSWSHL